MAGLMSSKGPDGSKPVHARRIFREIIEIWLAVVLTVFPAQAETRWVGGYGLELCELNQSDKPKCVYLSTGREVELTGNRRRDAVGTTLYEVITTDGALKGWVSKSERDSLDLEDPSIIGSTQTSCNEPEVGMSEQDVLATCWGKPRYRKRVGVEGLMRDQWVYGDGKFLYFDDGRLLAIEERRRF